MATETRRPARMARPALMARPSRPLGRPVSTGRGLGWPVSTGRGLGWPVRPIGPFPDGVDARRVRQDAASSPVRLPHGPLPAREYKCGNRSHLNLMTLNWGQCRCLSSRSTSQSARDPRRHAWLVTTGAVSRSRCHREQRAEVRKLSSRRHMIKRPARSPACPTALPPPGRRSPSSPSPGSNASASRLERGSHTLFVGEVVNAGFAEGVRSPRAPDGGHPDELWG